MPVPVHVALLVDRDGDTRTMYAEYLQLSHRWKIDEAGDGREALAKAISSPPHIVVTETRLPGISGFDLCRLLRTDPGTSDIPIIVVTADSYAGDVERAQTAGADAVLVKPCLPEQLCDEMARIVASANHLRARVRTAGERASAVVDKSTDIVEARELSARSTLSRAHRRHETVEPPTAPPSLVCPLCDIPLRYLRSHIGGVSARHPEQWDYFECTARCGTFQYRQRTRKLKKV